MPHRDAKLRQAYLVEYKKRKFVEDPEKTRAKRREYKRRWYDKDPKHARTLAKAAYARHRHKRRKQLITLYGGFCVCCGEARFEFLAIDHIEGGGKRHIASFKGNQYYYKWLLVERREGFRVLCHNCNLSLGFYGYCPHENAGSGTAPGVDSPSV